MLRFIIIVILAYAAFRLAARGLTLMSTKKSRAGVGGKPGEMVACARCGTFVLKAEAMRSGENFYCSRGCAKND